MMQRNLVTNFTLPKDTIQRKDSQSNTRTKNASNNVDTQQHQETI